MIAGNVSCLHLLISCKVGRTGSNIIKNLLPIKPSGLWWLISSSTKLCLKVEE